MNKLPLANDSIARKFTIGQVLDIEIQDVSKNRFQSVLIGLKNDRYLLAELPNPAKYGDLREKMFTEQELIVRTICEKTTGECLGFKSFIRAKQKLPEPLLFLAFPPRVEIRELRSEKRLLVSQPAFVIVESMNAHIYGMIMDLSGSGCRFEFDDTQKIKLQKKDVFHISFTHPETAMKIDCKAAVCSLRYFQNLVSVGLAFNK